MAAESVVTEPVAAAAGKKRGRELEVENSQPARGLVAIKSAPRVDGMVPLKPEATSPIKRAALKPVTQNKSTTTSLADRIAAMRAQSSA